MIRRRTRRAGRRPRQLRSWRDERATGSHGPAEAPSEPSAFKPGGIRHGLAPGCIRRWAASLVPTRRAILENRLLRPVAHRLADPALWRFRRKPVRSAVAIGLFCGLIVPVGQMPLAVIVALPRRANLIAATSATLVTNPLTFGPIYLLAYRLGGWIVTATAGGSPSVVASTAVGLVCLAILGALLGFAAVDLLWRRRVLARRRGPPAIRRPSRNG